MAFVAVIVTVVGLCVFNTQKSEGLSDVALANVEALANDDEDNWYCVGEADTCIEDDKGKLKGKKYTIDEEGPKD
jgi:hypothetical protein